MGNVLYSAKTSSGDRKHMTIVLTDLGSLAPDGARRISHTYASPAVFAHLGCTPRACWSHVAFTIGCLILELVPGTDDFLDHAAASEPMTELEIASGELDAALSIAPPHLETLLHTLLSYNPNAVDKTESFLITTAESDVLRMNAADLLSNIVGPADVERAFEAAFAAGGVPASPAFPVDAAHLMKRAVLRNDVSALDRLVNGHPDAVRSAEGAVSAACAWSDRAMGELLLKAGAPLPRGARDMDECVLKEGFAVLLREEARSLVAPRHDNYSEEAREGAVGWVLQEASRSRLELAVIFHAVALLDEYLGAAENLTDDDVLRAAVAALSVSCKTYRVRSAFQREEETTRLLMTLQDVARAVDDLVRKIAKTAGRTAYTMRPTAHAFLKLSDDVPERTRLKIEFNALLLMTDYHSLCFAPSLQAAAAAFRAGRVLAHSGYTKENMKECAARLDHLVATFGSRSTDAELKKMFPKWWLLT